MDLASNDNIIHWSSIKYKRVTQNILVAELYKVAHSFNIRAIIKATLRKVLQANMSLVFLYRFEISIRLSYKTWYYS